MSAGKLGLCCEECNTTHYAPFAPQNGAAAAVSWAYRYSLFVDDAAAAAWLAGAGVEFVPHLAHKNVPLPDGSSCTIVAAEAAGEAADGKKVPLCTAAALDAALAANGAVSSSGGKQPPLLTTRYLMGWNEAYDHSGSKAAKKYIAPADAAMYWRTVVQGLATRAHPPLSLVSPTTGVEKGKMEWLGDMLLACWATRDLGCDVETIVAFSVHDYKCGEVYWRGNYGANGTFQTGLAAYLLAAPPSSSSSSSSAAATKDWTSYVNARPIWVTETNCNGDNGFPPTGPVSRGEQCARITGQRADEECGQYGKCGAGSIAAMESMATIGRVSWWNTHQANKDNSTKTANAMLVDDAGQLYPAGRALVGGLPKGLDCGTS